MKMNELKQKIQQLIDKATEDNNKQKQTLSFLFDKLGEVKELETIDRLRKFQGGNKYLLAYLTYKSIVRANYQVELTKLTNFDTDEAGQDKLLEAINADIDNSIKEETNQSWQPTNQQLLAILSERIGMGEVKRELTDFGNFLMVETEQGILKVDLNDGKLIPNPVEELLKKHRIK